ncbi:hypothetical protein BGX38DRAFT_1281387 [Terfezia claveryi]|nr:hypothetical protein BGX38DRAFT_1281387 [Terfezia claveryi]
MHHQLPTHNSTYPSIHTSLPKVLHNDRPKENKRNFLSSWYEKHRETVLKLIKEDTGTDGFIMTKSLPPIYYPPPLTHAAITELRALDGVNVKVIEE